MDLTFNDLVNALSIASKNPFAEPVANMTFIGEINVLDTWENQTKQIFNDSESKFLQFFLHESTHHSSFIGPVGGAFSKLAISCYSQFWKVSDGQEKYNLTTRDILIYHFTWRLFEPLFEGIALFQEYDAIPGNSNCATNTTLFLTRFTIERIVEQLKNGHDFSIENPFDFIKNHIQKSRLISVKWECSKEEILKLSISQRPYYLLGYLAVKSTYQRLCNKCPQIANNSDFFIMFMNDYWFQDYKLESILLNVSEDNDYFTESQHTILKLGEYFQDKWDMLFLNIDKYIAECESYILKKTKKEPSYRNIELKHNENSINIESVLKSERFFNSRIPDIFNFRRDLRYSLEEKVKFESDGLTNEIILYSKFGTSTIPTIEIIKKGKYLATIEGFITHQNYLPVAIITDGFLPIAIYSPVEDSWNSDDLVRQYESFPPYPQIINFKQKLRDFKFISDNSELKKNIEHNELELNKFILGVYGQIAFGKGKDEIFKISEKLSSNGFETVMGELFEKIAKLSLFAGCEYRDLVQYSEITKEPIEKIIEEINSINNKSSELLGWVPFSIQKNRNGDYIIISKL